MMTLPNQDKPKIGRASWEFTYTGRVLAEVAKKRVEELEASIESRKAIEKAIREAQDKYEFISPIREQFEVYKEIREMNGWIFAFEKHPENKFDLDRDDFIYFFQER